MSFTFRQLEVFVEAAKDCNFRKTADRLGISQPSISNQIRMLERWSGCELFQRSRGSTPRLTAKGTALLGKAKELTAGKRQIATLEEPRARQEIPRLRIAAGPYLLDHYIRPALRQFLEKHDDVILDFLPPSAAKRMGSAVRKGEADIAVFTGGRAVRRLVGAEFLCETPCSLYGSARWARLAAKDSTRIGLLPFVLPLEGSGMEQWMLRSLKKVNISPQNVVARSQFADVIGDMVTSGKGISVLFDEHMAEHVRAGRALRLGPAIESGSRVLLIGPRARGRAAAPFVEFLRQVLKRETGNAGREGFRDPSPRRARFAG
jgi:DNA-binding transcriptional LysR family regulator